MLEINEIIKSQEEHNEQDSVLQSENPPQEYGYIKKSTTCHGC